MTTVRDLLGGGGRRLGRLLAKCRLLKPILGYVELHLADRCNMNCAGCGHFCPIADPWFADPAEHERDMRQLRRLFRHISEIRLMGGEPLLHREVERFLDSTRSVWPQADIRLVTNGILLPKMTDRFWRSCRDNRIRIDWTVYPPLMDRVESVCELVQAQGVTISAHKATQFFAHTNFRGDSDPGATFRACRSRYYCPFLKAGRLYVCAVQALASYPAKRFDVPIPSGGSIDIHAKGMTGLRVLDLLSRPAGACRFCSVDFPEFPWAPSKGDRSEWDAAVWRKP